MNRKKIISALSPLAVLVVYIIYMFIDARIGNVANNQAGEIGKFLFMPLQFCCLLWILREFWKSPKWFWVLIPISLGSGLMLLFMIEIAALIGTV